MLPRARSLHLRSQLSASNLESKPDPQPAARLASRSRRLPFLPLSVQSLQDGVPPPAGGPFLHDHHPHLSVRDSPQEEGRGRRPLVGGGHGCRRRRAARHGTYALPVLPRSPPRAHALIARLGPRRRRANRNRRRLPVVSVLGAVCSFLGRVLG
jgi:alkanesulfonate monooxygenase SsuD/methylene tetrahydromethanopterin reductase-like flavin-dependent oxidoreductase (luciferase family)